MASASRSPAATVAAPPAAAILLLLAIGAIQLRLDPATGVRLLLALLGAAVVVPWALRAASAERREPRLSGATTALILVGLAFVLSVLATLAELLGAEGGAGSVFWVSLVFGGVAAVPGWRLGSAVAALLSSLGLGVAFVALVDLVAGIDSLQTYRWLLLLVAVAYAVAAALLLGGRYRHAVQHVTAAGLAVLGLVLISFGAVVQGAIASVVLGGSGDLSFNGPFGWELIGLVGSGAVLAFAVLRRETGPGIVGGAAVVAAAAIASLPDGDGSLLGWPLLFALLAIAAVGAVFGANSRPSAPPPSTPPPRD